MVRRCIAAVIVASFLGAAVPALAQSDAGEIDITVTDATTKAPVVLARVLLDGPVIASEFTGANGKVIFTDVPDGIYRARVFSRGYDAITSKNFEVIDGHVVSVTVSLALSQGPLKIIGSVVAKSSATISTTDVSAESAQRKLSSDLADALGKLSGVSVTTSSGDSDATETISLEGQDASQTALTLDGIPLNAPGMAGDLRSIGTDLFTGASVRFGPQLGGLAGGVNFRTLEPTLSWQSAFSLSAGTIGRNNYSVAQSGSLGKLGIALMHTYRFSPSFLDGMIYRDTSGLDYDHQGDYNNDSNLIKLRYELTDAQALTAMFLSSSSDSEMVSTNFTGSLPRGFGPNNTHNSLFKMYSLTDSALVGDTQFQAAFFGNSGTFTSDLLNRYINGVAAPTGTISNNLSRGVSINATLPARERHTISINAYSIGSSTSFTPLVAQAQPFTYPGQSTNYSALQVNDALRSSSTLRFDASFGVSHASNAPGSLLAGISTHWAPTQHDSYALSYNVGGVAAHAGRSGFLSDPGQLTFDCNSGLAYGSAPGDEPGASSSVSTRASYTHQWRTGLLSVSFYRQAQNDVVLPVDVNGSVLSGEGLFPPDYFNQVQQIYNSQAGCGTPPGTPFGPQNVYYSTPIGGVRRVYEGAQLTGYVSFGNLVVEPYYDTQVAKALSGDPRLVNPYSFVIPGNQLPGVPLHRAGITFDYKSPHSALEYLADAQYTGANNWQNLPANTVVDAGVDVQLKRGSLVFAATNIFNTYGGVFTTSANAVPYTTLGGMQIPNVARPNSPRMYSATYTVRFGSPQAVQSQRAASAGHRANGLYIQTRGRGGRPRRFGSPLPAAPPADPFAMKTSELCTKDAQKTAQPILDGLKAYAARIEAAKTSAGYPATFAPPAIAGIRVEYHGMGSSYALSITPTARGAIRPLFGCTSFHIGSAQEAQQRHLYAPAQRGGMFFMPQFNFMPAVGIYFIRPTPQPGAESFRVYKLPSAPPKTPFELQPVANACTSALHATAAPLLAELQAHFGSGGATPDFTITTHAAKSGTWYAIDANDVSTVPAIISCGRVAAAATDALQKAGYDGSHPPTLNYASALGLYIVAPRLRFAAPVAHPSPSPSP